MTDTARIRATTQLHKTPAANVQISESLGAGTPVEILEDQGNWLHVKEVQSTHAIPGWAQREALAFPPPNGTDIFSSVMLANKESYASLFASAKTKDTLAWKDAPGLEKPDWIPQVRWGKISAGEQQSIKDSIRNFFQSHQDKWETWLAKIRDEGREEDANVDEWLAAVQGGRDVWTVRAEQIYPEPSTQKNGLGWANVNDIMRWTGKVQRNDQETKYKLWYEVSMLKSGRMLNGWYKADLIEPYIFPTESTDTTIAANQETQFDLTKPILRHPADQEIEDAIAAKRAAYQYIDIFNVLGIHKIHHNLCGEFCAATLAGVDIIPFLNQWKDSYADAEKIIRNNLPTGLGDIKSMLSLFNLPHEEFRYTPSITPVSPVRLLKLLEEGKKVFWGVAIFKSNGKLSGTVSNSSTTRHWIVLEDLIPVGNNGWVRIYNPFRNREEVYTYDWFIQSVGQFGIGLLVDKA